MAETSIDRASLTTEVAAIRARDVDRVVQRKIDRAVGNCTTEQIESWQAQAYREWRERWPTLNSLLIPHVNIDQYRHHDYPWDVREGGFGRECACECARCYVKEGAVDFCICRSCTDDRHDHSRTRIGTGGR